MKMSSLFKKKKKKLIATPSGIYYEDESVDAEGSDGWIVKDFDDDGIFNNLEEKESPLKKSISKKKSIFKKKSSAKKKSLSKKKKTI